MNPLQMFQKMENHNKICKIMLISEFTFITIGILDLVILKNMGLFLISGLIVFVTMVLNFYHVIQYHKYKRILKKLGHLN